MAWLASWSAHRGAPTHRRVPISRGAHLFSPFFEDRTAPRQRARIFQKKRGKTKKEKNEEKGKKNEPQGKMFFAWLFYSLLPELEVGCASFDMLAVSNQWAVR